MAMLKKAATIAIVASAGVMGTAGIASAYSGDGGPHSGDNGVGQAGLLPVNALNNADVSPNLGCLLDRTLPDLTAQGLVGLVPVGVSLNHLLEHANLNVLANGNTTTDVYDNSCTSNEGSSQAGNNSNGSTGAGGSSSEHNTGNDAGSHNSANGEGAGGVSGGINTVPSVAGPTNVPSTAGPVTAPSNAGPITTPSTAGPVTAPYAAKHALPAAEVLGAAEAGPDRASGPSAGSLAHTGADIGAPLAGAGAALLGGFALRTAARRREGVQ